MAENIKIGIDVDDGGSTKKTIKDVEALRRAYDDVANSAKQAGAVRAAMAPKTTAAVKGASQSSSDGVDYGVARAAVGTGASGRDFAKQAQGLGGLVHVYATLAANLFAVGAAFRALSDAMNTANMIKGLDQLGAASGRSLGNLAKDMVKITDGAISLKESMSAVALSSAGGMSNKQILQMAEVAKKASQALGFSLPDAVNRLSKGITKLQPELLDELGIMTRVDSAYAKYALSIGKSVSSLSEFEKHQAFANAVLAEGEKKFSNIDIPANPYDKLLASMTDVATSGLNLLNVVLGPIVKLLAESPMALAGVFAVIGTTLLKQAIPALGAWREGLAKTAVESAANAKRVHDAFQIYSVEKELAELDKKIGPIQKSINDKISQAQTMLATTLSKKSKLVAQSMSGNVDAEALGKGVDTEIKRRTTLLDKTKELYKNESQGDPQKISAYKQMIALEEKRISNLKVTKDVLASVAKDQAAIEASTKKVESKKPAWYTGEGMRGMIEARAEQKASSSQILSQTGADTATKGMGQAFKNLFENIKSGAPLFDELGNKIGATGVGLKGLRAVTTGVSGSLLIMGSAMSTAMAAFAPWLELIGLLIVAYQMFDSWASKAAKQQEEFNSKVTENESVVKAAADTFDLYVIKKKEAFSTNSITAFSQSLGQVSETLNAQLFSLDKFNEAAGGWDKFKDSFSAIWGGSNTQQVVKSTIADIQTISKLLQNSSNQKEAVEGLAKALKIDPKNINDVKVLEKAFAALSSSDKVAKAKEIAKGIDEISKKEAFAANATKAFAESLVDIGKVSDQIAQSNAFTDLQGKLGTELVTAANKFAQALENPLMALTAIVDLSKDPKMLANLTASTFKDAQTAAGIAKQLNDAEVALEAARSKVKENTSAAKQGSGGRENTVVRKANAEDVAAVASAEKLVNTYKLAGKEFIDAFGPKMLEDMYKVASDKIELGVKRAKEVAAIGVARTQLGIYAGAGAPTAQRELDLKLKEISIQESLIKASYEQQMAVTANSEELSKLSALQSIEVADRVAANTKATVVEKATGEGLRASGMKALEMFQAKAELRSGVPVTTGNQAQLSAQAALNSEALIKRQMAAALAGTEGAKKSAKLTAEDTKSKETLSVSQKQADTDIQRKNTLLETTKENIKLLGIYDETLALKEKDLTISIASRTFDKEELAVNRDIAALKKGAGATSKENLEAIKLAEDGIAAKKAQTTEVNKSTEAEYLSNKLKGLETIRQREVAAQKEKKAGEEAIQSAAFSVQETTLAYNVALGKVTTEQGVEEKANIDIAKLKVSLAKELFDITESETVLKKEQTRIDDLLKSNREGLDTTKLQALLDGDTEALKKKKEGIIALNEAQQYNITSTAEMQSTFMQMNNVVKNAFQGMADSLLNFVKTGKLDFKSLVDSMLSDMLRIMLSKQASALFAAAQPGIGDFFKNIGFGPASKTPGTPVMDAGITSMTGNIGANGLIYGSSGRIDKFAQGGSFTNSIVNSPTLFKFAKGTGLMGEAGPEAIMPLKRDSNGTLGIRGGGGGTTAVVVNNYGSSPATTKETVDSKGNRKIEVVIGDIVAGELSRAGSPTQQAMGTNFGARPTVLRR